MEEKQGWAKLVLQGLDKKPWAAFLALSCLFGSWGWVKYVKQVEKTEDVMEARVNDQKELVKEQREMSRQSSELIYNQGSTLRLQQDLIKNTPQP